MPETYLFECRDGQNLSQILNQEYGYVDADLLWQVLELNEGLAAKPLVLTLGTQIHLPVKESVTVPTLQVQTLW